MYLVNCRKHHPAPWMGPGAPALCLKARLSELLHLLYLSVLYSSRQLLPCGEEDIAEHLMLSKTKKRIADGRQTVYKTQPTAPFTISRPCMSREVLL